MGSRFNRPRQASLVLAALLLLTFVQGSATAFAATSQPLPADRLHFGVSSEPNRLAWMTGSGVPWRYRYTYLSAGVNTGQGWATWNQPAGQYATYYLEASHAAGYIPVFSYYMLLQSRPSTGPDERTRDFNNLNNPSTMAAYYADFKFLMERAGAYGGPAVAQVEPDLWGYLQITSGNTTPDRVPAAVASSGQADAAGLPDNRRVSPRRS